VKGKRKSDGDTREKRRRIVQEDTPDNSDERFNESKRSIKERKNQRRKAGCTGILPLEKRSRGKAHAALKELGRRRESREKY